MPDGCGPTAISFPPSLVVNGIRAKMETEKFLFALMGAQIIFVVLKADLFKKCF